MSVTFTEMWDTLWFYENLHCNQMKIKWYGILNNIIQVRNHTTNTTQSSLFVKHKCHEIIRLQFLENSAFVVIR